MSSDQQQEDEAEDERGEPRILNHQPGRKRAVGEAPLSDEGDPAGLSRVDQDKRGADSGSDEGGRGAVERREELATELVEIVTRTVDSRIAELGGGTATVESTTVSEASRWSGPLPRPQTLVEYEDVVPGAAERIISMAEHSLTGAIRIDSRLADAEITTVKRGQVIAGLLTAVSLVASIIFFAAGNAIAGGALISMPLVLLVQSFLRSAFQQGTPTPDSSHDRHDDDV